MARQDAAALLASTGLPVVYDRWPDGATPTFPCIRYMHAGEANMRCDNGDYFRVDEWDAYLITEWKDDATEALLEGAFEDAGIVPSRFEDEYDRDERLYTASWRFQLPR